MKKSFFPALGLVLLASCSAPPPPPVPEPVPSRSTDDVDPLLSLPYVSATYDPDGDKRGVLVYEEGKAWEGVNFFSSRDLPAAFLFAMNGDLLHVWRRRTLPWQHVELLPTGEVLVLVKNRRLFKIDLESRVLWDFEAPVHHDLARSADGRIFVLTSYEQLLRRVHPSYPFKLDYITVLSSEGEKLEEHSVLELFLRSPFADVLSEMFQRAAVKGFYFPGSEPLDILHTNHVEILDGSLAARSPIFAGGNVLLSLRTLNTIAIADLGKGEVVWTWGGVDKLYHQHHPTVLENGNILVFNNGYEQSSVLEVDPLSGEVVWSYAPGKELFSETRGSNQRLPNGNTLITESDTGYALEVTPAGETVWEFANPQVNEKSERSAIWRMVRFRREALPFLESLREIRDGMDAPLPVTETP